MTDRLTHIGPDGRARMVDISSKADTAREAVAEGRIRMAAATLDLAMSGQARKGDPCAIAELAGIMATKRTADLIPLCHPLALTGVDIDITPAADLPGLLVRAKVRTTGKTGVEMEALTAVSVACLTLYDMLKAVDKAMVIEGITLTAKSGGASGGYQKPSA
ncbi:MAG: cyclic pyranopterin monophosphate synthase MoaC [Hyphomonas sp.]|uniref:cyclic pyranopterin monophosphate synthase MoaC n=1 Tax=Hyphomonas sp. TaxID=87 RepID=UPI0030039EA2